MAQSLTTFRWKSPSWNKPHRAITGLFPMRGFSLMLFVASYTPTLLCNGLTASRVLLMAREQHEKCFAKVRAATKLTLALWLWMKEEGSSPRIDQVLAIARPTHHPRSTSRMNAGRPFGALFEVWTQRWSCTSRTEGPITRSYSCCSLQPAFHSLGDLSAALT